MVVRHALIILDGLGDHIDPSGAHPTPLELARTPHLDRLAGEGTFGRASILGPGIAPESDAGVLALLGYDPVKDSPGRGVLEAVGSEIPLAPGDVALRLNFATADGDGRIVDSRVGRNLSTGESKALAEAITKADLLASERVRAEVRATVGHRGVLWLHPTDGAALSGNVSNADPFYDKVGGMGQARKTTEPKIRTVQPLDDSAEARRTARVIDLLAERVSPVLSAHSVNARRAMAGKKVANVLLLRNAGGLPQPPPVAFRDRHGRPGAAVTEMPVERGIARLFGLADHFVGPMGPDRDAALRERADLTGRVLAESPFVYVHLKGPDEPAHDGLADVKREIIEALDRSFFGPFLEGLDRSEVRIAVTADHATPASAKSHSDDPVPLLYWGAGVSPSGWSGKFCERACAESGPLGLRPAREVLPLLFGPAVPAESA
ncbi:MAG TPA: alkaline phosphatase family protein [Thermoplasmata archaeon]|nr:alkaline phosphatase family protein [Thermoplasmata archaeon]